MSSREELMLALRDVLKAHGVVDGVLVLQRENETVTWIFPGCPDSCDHKARCAAKSLELTAAYLEDRADALLDRDTSQTRAVKTKNVLMH